MINFIRANKHILGLILLTLAAISAGCTTKAETTRKTEPTEPKREVVETTQTPGYRMNQDPYYDRDFDSDMEYSTPTPTKSSATLTKASFGKIKVGMTLEEVEKLLDEKGMLVSTMDVNGRKTQIYKWSSDNFKSYIDVTIESGKVVEKKDKGLK
jgi:hypothetical protein